MCRSKSSMILVRRTGAVRKNRPSAEPAAWEAKEDEMAGRPGHDDLPLAESGESENRGRGPNRHGGHVDENNLTAGQHCCTSSVTRCNPSEAGVPCPRNSIPVGSSPTLLPISSRFALKAIFVQVNQQPRHQHVERADGRSAAAATADSEFQKTLSCRTFQPLVDYLRFRCDHPRHATARPAHRPQTQATAGAVAGRSQLNSEIDVRCAGSEGRDRPGCCCGPCRR